MKIAANQSRAVSVQFTNENGRPAKVEGEVTWASSDEAVATVSTNASDPLQALVIAGPKSGEVKIIATADADLGEGVTTVEATLDVEVLARGEAVGGEITPVQANQGLPGQGGNVDNSLPGQPGRPDNSLPDDLGRPDRVDNELPSGRPDRPDQELPDAQPDVDNELPGSPERPDQDLPDHPTPKR